MKAAKEMKREELLTDAMLFFSPNERSITAENGARYYREDVVLKAMELAGKESPLPPAEGAEEILRRIVGETENGFKRDFAWFSEAIAAMQEFATLHAQKIADKMESERLKNAPRNCPKAAQCAHVKGGLKCPPNVICPL